ncbi:uncharacterized protein TNCV_4173181 [Trichonephila clavipes]|nr:uncharacterized protein TNCV_4173181 [Trichonephila clavipes]
MLRRSEALQYSINAVPAVFNDLEKGVLEIFNCYLFSYLDYRYRLMPILDNSNSATNGLNVTRPFRQQPNSCGWARESTVKLTETKKTKQFASPYIVSCYGGRGSRRYRYRIVACFVTSSSPVPLKIRRVGQRCTLNLSRAETSSGWCGVVVRRGGASSGVVHVT